MNGKELEPEQAYGGSIESDDSDNPRVAIIGSRMGHCLTTVFQQTDDRYSNFGSLPLQNTNFSAFKKDQNSRGMWIYERVFSKDETSKGKEFKEGFYLFGGHNREEENLNDLWLIKPEYYTNKRMIDDVKYTYTCRDPELTLNVSQITNFSGQPPCPRTGATMITLNIKKTGHQLLVIYGGRNDQIYKQTGSAALNDVCIFNINLRKWESLAMFGQMPMSRWKHSMVSHFDD